MTENLVERLEFAADDESGQFCEALVIQSGGREHYVLHRYFSEPLGDPYAPGPPKMAGVDEKTEYQTREGLIIGFPYGPGGMGSAKGWERTDPQCGFHDIPLEEFNRAMRMDMRPLSKGNKR